jgi:hypothetical protein
MVDIFDPEFSQGVGDLGPGLATQQREFAKIQGLHEMQKQLDRHRLLIEVLVRALIDKDLYTRDQLNALANLVDMEDGVRDGKLAPQKGIRHCSKCGRVMMNVSGTCLYCGYQEVMELV